MSEVNPAAPPAVTFSFSVELLAPDVMTILLNGSTEGIAVDVPADNNGYSIADVTVVTHSGKPYTKALQLGGTDGAKFNFSNGGVAPCDLRIGSQSLPGGGYNIKITAP